MGAWDAKLKVAVSCEEKYVSGVGGIKGMGNVDCMTVVDELISCES